MIKNTHTASVVAHVNDMISRARARGCIVTALDIDGIARFEIGGVVADGVMIRDTATGRYCCRWQEVAR